jgi:hypothetical protein
VTRSPKGRHHSAPGLSGGQEAQLRELFALHGMEQGYLETIVGKLEGGLPTSRVSRHLKAMGLRRGVLTPEQVTFSTLENRSCNADGFQSDRQAGDRKRRIKIHGGEAGVEFIHIPRFPPP